MNSINFLPDQFMEHAERTRRRPMNFLAIGVTAVALSTVWVFGGRAEVLASRADSLETQIRMAEQQRQQADAIRAEIVELESRHEIARELSPPVTTAHVLATIAQVAPEPIKLTNLQVIAHRPDPRPIPLAEQTRRDTNTDTRPAWLEVTLMGIAPGQSDIVELTRALSEHPLFTQVRPRSSGVATLRRYEARDFLIVLRVDLDREIVPTTTQGGETHAD